MQKPSSLFNRPGLFDKGLAGEEAFLSWHAHYFGRTTEISDVRANPEYQSKEIDFILFAFNGQERSYEVKSDDRVVETGNLTFELCRIHHTSETIPAYLGWSVFSQADRLAVWCEPAASMYVMSMTAFRRGMQRYMRDNGPKAFIRPVMTDDTRTTVNIFVPLSYIEHTRFVMSGASWSIAA